MKKYLKNNKLFVAVFFVLMALAIFVRVYNFHDWLYFKMDQSRDALLISHSIENGAGYLPLLGPRAGATKVSHGYLRLGPMFYYFEYISGKIFNSTRPEVFAYPDLFFSILTIPLLFLFLRFYFSRKNSLLITAMYAFSFIVIQYSRFSWNPNSLLFFTLLTFYSMLKFLNTEKGKQKIVWVALWALGVAVGSQLHFMGLFCLVGISLAAIFLHYELWKAKTTKELKNRSSWKKIAGYSFTFLAVFALIYSPVIISEVMKKGENTKNFIEAFSTKPKSNTLSNKISLSLDKQVKYYCLLTTSECYKGATDYKSFSVIFTILLMISGVGLAVYQLVKRPKSKVAGENATKKDFLWLLLAWFGSIFVLAIPLYGSLRPRFFIFVFPVPFIFLGLIFEFLEHKFSAYKKQMMLVTLIVTAGILLANTNGTKAWFAEQAKAQTKSTTIDRTLILKNQDGVTYGQLERIADYMYKRMQPGNTLYFFVKPEHVMPIRYALLQKNDPNLQFEPIKSTHYTNSQYFAIIPAKNNPDSLKTTFNDNFEILNSFQAGELKVYELKFTSVVDAGKKMFNRDTGKTDRIFWKDVFGIKGDAKDNADIQGLE